MRTKKSVRWLMWSLPVAALALASWTSVTWAQEKKAEEPKAKDLVDTVKATPALKTFSELIEAAALTGELKGPGPYTLLAPTNDAFKNVDVVDLKKPANKDKLAKIIKNHIVKGKVDLAKAKTVKTMADAELPVTVKEGVTMVGDAKVAKAVVAASNGTIHEVDKVLMPAEKPATPPKAPAEPPKKEKE